MNIANLKLYELNFFCPATGVQIHGPQFFKPSPATLMLYQDSLGMEYMDEALEPYMKKALEEVEAGNYQGYNLEYDGLDKERKAFEILTKAEFKDEQALMLFSIHDTSASYGALISIVHIIINMTYDLDQKHGIWKQEKDLT